MGVPWLLPEKAIHQVVVTMGSTRIYSLNSQTLPWLHCSQQVSLGIVLQWLLILYFPEGYLVGIGYGQMAGRTQNKLFVFHNNLNTPIQWYHLLRSCYFQKNCSQMLGNISKSWLAIFALQRNFPVQGPDWRLETHKQQISESFTLKEFVLTFRPYRHWKKITPTDHTSTLLDIFGGSFPTTKHSGGKYLQKDKKIKSL